MAKRLVPEPANGFTLIELLFVIAVIAVLVAFGLSTYRERTLNTKAEKIALQMQEILQAGTNYYVQFHCWPDSLNSNGGAGGCTPTNFVQNFIPAIGMRNPNDNNDFSLYNIFAPTYGTTVQEYRYTYGLPYDQKAGMYINNPNLFEVRSGKLLGDKDHPQFAQRVAALLPNATEIWDDYWERWYVKAQVSVPGTQAALSPFILVGMGKVEADSNHNIVGVNNCYKSNCSVEFACPLNYWPIITLSMQNFSVSTRGAAGLGAQGIIKRVALEVHPKGKCKAYKPTIGANYTVKCWPYANIEGRGSGVDRSTKNQQDGSAYFFYTAGCCKRGTVGCSAHPDYLVKSDGTIDYEP